MDAVDESSGQTAQARTFECLAPAPDDYPIDIQAPVENGFQFPEMPITWLDKMVLTGNDDIQGGKRYYAYNLQITRDDGQTWGELTTKTGYGDIDMVINITAQVQAPYSDEQAKIRITDLVRPNRSVESGTFTILNDPTGNIVVDKIWDYSYPERYGNPSGVAADGVGRIYLKLYEQEASGVAITSVEAELSGDVGTEARVLGKLMPATVTNQYSMEANDADEIEITVTQAGQDNAFWFWYVAPDDFEDPDVGIHTITATFTVNFEDDTYQEITEPITIVRPPLVLVHGLGGNPSTWDNFSLTGVPGDSWRNEYRYEIIRVLKMEPADRFEWNAIKLLSVGAGNVTVPTEHNSLPYVIYEIRENGYAANQVEYICHSMGGSILRTAVNFANGDTYYGRYGVPFKNYEKGYVNRAITLDTPHNGSPLAGLLSDIVGEINADFRLRNLLYAKWFLNIGSSDEAKYPYHKLPFTWFVPVDGPGDFKLTGAVKNLQLDESAGGVIFPMTDVPTHLIVGDLIPGDQSGLPDIPPEVWETLAAAEDFLDFFDELTPVLFTLVPDNLEDDFENNLDEVNYAKKVITKIKLALQIYSTASFLAESDVIVSVESQLAGQTRTPLSATIFDWTTHTPLLFFDSITANLEVNEKANYLLNRKINSPQFNPIPANTSTHIRSIPVRTPKTLTVRDDSTTIQILSPADGSALFVDDELSIRVSVPDMVDLKYIDIRFQKRSYTTTDSDTIFAVNIPINGNVLGEQIIEATAFYDDGDGVAIATHAVSVQVETNSPAEHLIVEPFAMRLDQGETSYPDYRVAFDSFVTTLSYGNSEITGYVEDPSIAMFDAELSAITGLVQGDTRAIISYQGVSDTIYIAVSASSVPTEPTLFVTPAVQEIPSSSGTISFAIYNTGSGDMNWTAESDDSWLTISSGSSGVNDGEIAVDYAMNNGDARTGAITITSPDAVNSPITVEIQQAMAGDINGDGEIAHEDVTLMLNAVLGQGDLTGAQFLAADVNGDGVLDITDIVGIVSLMVD